MKKSDIEKVRRDLNQAMGLPELTGTQAALAKYAALVAKMNPGFYPEDRELADKVLERVNPILKGIQDRTLADMHAKLDWPAPSGEIDLNREIDLNHEIHPWQDYTDV